MSQPSSESSSTTAPAEKTSTSASSTSPSSASASSSNTSAPPVPVEAKGRRYEKKDKEFWSKTGQRNVKTIHKTSGRFPRKKEASRDTTGAGKTGPTASGGEKKPPAKKERRMYLPWE